MMRNVVVILPTYNEVQNIELIINQIFDVSELLNGYDVRVLVVDDKSPDGTANVVKKMFTQQKMLHLISGEKNGLGEAYMRGIKHSFRNYKPDFIIMMDSDLSHDPYAIPDMFKVIERGADVVIGSRYTTDGYIPGNWPLIRIINSKVASSLAYAVSGISREVKDLTSGFRLIRVTRLKKINLSEIQTKGYSFLINILYELLNDGADVKEVPITFKERKHGSSKLRVKDILEFVKCVFRLNPDSTVRRIIRFGMVGLVGAVVNLGILFWLKNNTVWPIFLCSSIAIETSIVSNFILHSFYTFQSLNSDGVSAWWGSVRKFFTFNLSSLAVAAITLLIFSLLNGTLGINYLLAQFLAICISFAANYLISNRFIWTQNATN
jgi:dolichol-phosphate mannosyltransferase